MVSLAGMLTHGIKTAKNAKKKKHNNCIFDMVWLQILIQHGPGFPNQVDFYPPGSFGWHPGSKEVLPVAWPEMRKKATGPSPSPTKVASWNSKAYHFLLVGNQLDDGSQIFIIGFLLGNLREH